MRPLLFVIAFFVINAVILLVELPDWRAGNTLNEQPAGYTSQTKTERLIQASWLISPENYMLTFLAAASAMLSQHERAPSQALADLRQLEGEFAINILAAQRMHIGALLDLEDTLAAYVQLRLHAFQQVPVDECDRTPKLKCGLSKACGFACIIHHVADCLIVAQETGRTLILNEQGWLYDFSPDDPEKHIAKRGWRYFFRPISSCKYNSSMKTAPQYTDLKQYDLNDTVVSLPMIDIRASAHWAVYYVPTTLKPLIELFHNRSALWYLGQVEKYILRLNNESIAFTERVKARMNFRHPSIGVHIRRTDKLDTEAKFHDTGRYYRAAMRIVNATANTLTPRRVTALSLERRRIDKLVGFDWNWFSSPVDVSLMSVYAAADELRSCAELRKHFPAESVMCNDVSIESAAIDKRNSRLSLLYLLSDVFHLAESDIFVGTFSSHVARLVYELMQDCTRLDVLPSMRVKSLDDKWYYSG